jgi:hypothetical protein
MKITLQAEKLAYVRAYRKIHVIHRDRPERALCKLPVFGCDELPERTCASTRCCPACRLMLKRSGSTVATFTPEPHTRNEQ